MKNIAIIPAGGIGRRYGSESKPKQFIEVNDKPIIIHTIEKFSNHANIHAIIIVCQKDWIEYLDTQLTKFNIKKVVAIVPGGDTNQESIFHGLIEASKQFNKKDLVIIHDSVRPLINPTVINENIATTLKYGNCITCSPANETLLLKNDNDKYQVIDRNNTFVARAPQTFILEDLFTAHRQALLEKNTNFTDSSTLMLHYGHRLNILLGNDDNLKITTKIDLHTFKTHIEAINRH